MHLTDTSSQVPSNNPMQPTVRLNAAPRCDACSRTPGNRCRGPAARVFRACRMHGSRGGAPPGKQGDRVRRLLSKLRTRRPRSIAERKQLVEDVA